MGMMSEASLRFPTGNTHRKPDIGGLEGRIVVGTISSHANNLTERMKGLNTSLLVFWGGLSQDLETKGDLYAFLWVEGTEHGTLRDDTSSSIDTTLSGD